MRERDWLVPSIALTLLSGLFALALIPSYSGILPALRMLPLWIVAAALLAAVYGYLTMMLARVDNPIARVRLFFGQERHVAIVLAAGIVLAGLNMIAFMWAKPLLNYLVPFWADPLLADLDRLIFLGRDPWTLLTWLNATPMAMFYHVAWFVLMILALVIVLAAPPSPRKSAVMLTYFILWSLVGPLVHTLVPAAGPVFFEQLGYGSRFGALHNVSETREVADYLWTIYAGEGFGPGSGISAMPSMHIATTVWIILAIRSFARPLFAPMVFAGFLIFLLSIALGWHYAVDGIVGGGAALACHQLLLRYFNRRRAPCPAVAVAA